MQQFWQYARCTLPLAYGISYQKYPKTVLTLFLISQYSFIFKQLSEYSFLTSYASIVIFWGAGGLQKNKLR